MLQLTRSLGDTPFHKDGAVTHLPEFTTVRVVDEDEPIRFLICATDGLWDHFSNDNAVETVDKLLEDSGRLFYWYF